MDAESLKIILELKEENTLLRRAIDDAIVMIEQRKEHFCLVFNNNSADILIRSILRMLSEIEIEKKGQNPSENTQHTNNDSN